MSLEREAGSLLSRGGVRHAGILLKISYYAHLHLPTATVVADRAGERAAVLFYGLRVSLSVAGLGYLQGDLTPSASPDGLP